MKKALHHNHGGRPEKDFERLSMDAVPVIDFSVNLNPLGYPEIIRRRWPDLIQGIEKYPSLDGEGIARFLEERLGVPTESILAGNGSTEMIYLLPRALRLRRVAIVTPSYHDYYRATVLAGAEAVQVPLRPENMFRPPKLEDLTRSLENVDALWLGNPNNPTGTFWSGAELRRLAREKPHKLLVIDEAFMPFLEEWKQESLAVPPLLPNVIVLHSLTKFYGLAGLRLGGVTAAPGAIRALREVKEPWTVNSVADSVASLLGGCRGYEVETRRMVLSERERMSEAFAAMIGLQAFPARANFLLLRWGLGDLDLLQKELLSRGIYVRDCRNFPGLESDYFRVAVRTPWENDCLLQAVSSIL